MKKLNIISIVAALGVLAGSAAFAADRTTASATLVNPNTHAYVGTFIQNCFYRANGPGVSIAPIGKGGGYVGVYLAQSFQVQGNATLGISTDKGMAFTTSSRANGEEGWVTEIGGQSKLACLPIGTKVTLMFSPSGHDGEGSIFILGTGVVK